MIISFEIPDDVVAPAQQILDKYAEDMKALNLPADAIRDHNAQLWTVGLILLTQMGGNATAFVSLCNDIMKGKGLAVMMELGDCDRIGGNPGGN